MNLLVVVEIVDMLLCETHHCQDSVKITEVMEAEGIGAQNSMKVAQLYSIVDRLGLWQSQWNTTVGQIRI